MRVVATTSAGRLAGADAPARTRAFPSVLRDPRRALVVALVALSVIPCLDPVGDPDLWWHVRAGRWILDNRAFPRSEMFTYTAAGNPWTAHEWGSEVLFAILSAAGGALLVGVVMALVTWSGLWALALRARDRGAGWGVCAVAMLLGARAMQPVTGSRPQMLTFALCCWTLLLAERHLARGGRRVWLLPLIVAVWANLHAGFLFGIGLIAAVAGIEALRAITHRPGAFALRRVGELGAAVAASVLAACINPYGPGLIAYALRLTHEVSGLPIVEWMRPDPLSWGMAAADLLAVTMALLVLRGGRVEWRDALLSVGGVVAALIAVRNLAVLVAVALPAWAALVQAALDRRPAARAKHRPAPHVAIAILATAVAGVGVATARAAQAASAAGIAEREPVCATALLARSPEALRLFAPYATSGYVIGALWPHATVYDYGELLAPGPQVLANDIRIAAGTTDSPSAMSLLDGSRTVAVLMVPGALTAELASSGGWMKALSDPTGMELWLRGDPAWARRELLGGGQGEHRLSGLCPTWFA